MKKIFTILIFISFSTLLMNCVSGKKQMNEALNNVEIGISKTEFNKLFPKKELVAMKNGVTIYKVSKRVWYDSNGSGSAYRFFYFSDNRLTQMDKGERATDYRIKIDTN